MTAHEQYLIDKDEVKYREGLKKETADFFRVNLQEIGMTEEEIDEFIAEYISKMFTDQPERREVPMDNIFNAVITRVVLTRNEAYADLGVRADLQTSDELIQSFGVYPVYNRTDGGDYGGEFILRLLETVGVGDFKDLEGKSVRIRRDGNRGISAIGHFLKDKWFCPSEEFREKG